MTGSSTAQPLLAVTTSPRIDECLDALCLDLSPEDRPLEGLRTRAYYGYEFISQCHRSPGPESVEKQIGEANFRAPGGGIWIVESGSPASGTWDMAVVERVDTSGEEPDTLDANPIWRRLLDRLTAVENGRPCRVVSTVLSCDSSGTEGWMARSIQHAHRDSPMPNSWLGIVLGASEPGEIVELLARALDVVERMRPEQILTQDAVSNASGHSVERARESAIQLSECMKTMKEIVVAARGVDDTDEPIDDSDPLHLSSIQSLEVIVMIEDVYGIEFPDDRISPEIFESLSALALVVHGLLVQTATHGDVDLAE